ncbi:MAG: ROK family transcriptional regulator [Bifidobacteriaceae bacterium]|jgi:predicted NBD/HSP70 family sugar kinase|nr:ROK family transcriptional regulator [Bifidobacteriaceae bacterium]
MPSAASPARSRQAAETTARGTAGRLAIPAAPANQASLRRHNLAIVYQLIARSAEPLSRAELSERAGVTRATASSLVDQLVAGRLVEELDARTSGRAGRPATPVRLARGTVAGLGLEINVDYLGARAVDLAGVTLAERIESADLAGADPGAAIGALAELARRVKRSLNARGTRLTGATLAVAGAVDRASGRLRAAPNLGWRDVDLGRALRARLRLGPLNVDNEAALAARAELAAWGDPAASFVYVSGGIGIGAGIVRAGALDAGAHGWAGEIGHVTVDPTGPACACGSNGCLEQYAGRRAVLAAIGAGTRAATGTADGVARRAAAGDQPTLAALETAGRALGLALGAALNFADVGTVVLGGDFADLAAFLRPPLEAELARRVVSWGWVPADQTVRVSRAPDRPALTGAALAAADLVAADPEAHCSPPGPGPEATGG